MSYGFFISPFFALLFSGRPPSPQPAIRTSSPGNQTWVLLLERPVNLFVLSIRHLYGATLYVIWVDIASRGSILMIHPVREDCGGKRG